MSRELRVHSVQSPAEKIRTAVEIVAIVAAGLWALYTFVYEQQIKPLSEPPEFSVPTTIEQGPTIDGVVFLTIHKRVENTGSTPIDIAAESLAVYGERTASPAGTVQTKDKPTSLEIRSDIPLKPVALLYSFAKLRQGAVGGDPGTDFYMPAHSSAEETELIAIPAKAYQVILVVRRDYIARAPIAPKIAVTIAKGLLGAYELHSKQQQGENDTITQYAIRP